MGGEQAGGTPPSSTESTGRQLSAWHVVVMGLVGGGLGGALSVVVPRWVLVGGAIVLVAVAVAVLAIAGKSSGQEAGTARGVSPAKPRGGGQP